MREGKSWKTGSALWEESRSAGLGVPVLFATASRKGELLYVASLDQIKLEADGATAYRVSDARCVGGHFKTELVVASTGEPLSPASTRPNAICTTPVWLSSMELPRVIEKPHESVQVAQGFIESLVPVPQTRTAALWRLADAIVCAAKAGGEWGITLRKDQHLLRLNIGMTEAFVLQPGGAVSVLVDPKLVPQQLRRALGTRPYPSAGGAVLMDFDADSLEDIIEVEDAQRSAARNAHRNRCLSRDSHEPTVLAYLEGELGRPMPRPAWAQPDMNAEAGHSGVAPRKHFVALHNREKQGQPFLDAGEVIEEGDEFSFYTRKAYKPETLHGSRLWAFEAVGSPRRYTLACTGMIDALPKHKDGDLRVKGRCDMTLQPRDVTDEPWFKDLYREQHNFSLGLNAVRNQAAIDALEEIVSSGRTAAPANPDGPAETEGAPGPDLAVTEDSRTRAMHAITERQGRGRFREAALAAYKHQCAISSYDADEALEAAHISAYMGPHTDRLDNTLLLRADLHTLFDRHLMAIDTTTWKVIIAQDLMHTTYYREFHGERVRLPDREADRPRAEYLDEHRRKANL